MNMSVLSTGATIINKSRIIVLFGCNVCFPRRPQNQWKRTSCWLTWFTARLQFLPLTKSACGLGSVENFTLIISSMRPSCLFLCPFFSAKANVMLEYDIDEAQALLEKNLSTASRNLETLEDDLDFLRDQFTTTEVSIL